MPNTTPIPELIAEEIVDRLERITVDNGFAFDVAFVTRGNRLGTNFLRKPYGILVILGDNVRNEEMDHEGNPPAIAYDLTVMVKCLANIADTDDGSHNTRSNQMIAAAMKAITNPTVSPSTWYTLGGNAIEANFGDIEYFSASEGDHAGATLPIEVTYRISETDPFTVRA
jgi:hypothetical protein